MTLNIVHIGNVLILHDSLVLLAEKTSLTVHCKRQEAQTGLELHLKCQLDNNDISWTCKGTWKWIHISCKPIAQAL